MNVHTVPYNAYSPPQIAAKNYRFVIVVPLQLYEVVGNLPGTSYCDLCVNTWEKFLVLSWGANPKISTPGGSWQGRTRIPNERSFSWNIKRIQKAVSKKNIFKIVIFLTIDIPC